MQRKVLGIVIILFSIICFIINFSSDEGSLWRLIFNYQFIIVILGLVIALFKKKKIGWFVTGVGVYLYLAKFIPWFEGLIGYLVPIGVLAYGFYLLVVDKSNGKDTVTQTTNGIKEEIKETKEEIEDAVNE